MPEADVIIVGAGVAGLACALSLHRAGKRVVVLEASDFIGGRVRTDFYKDFSLDRGFQVLLTAYPTCRELLDIKELHLGAFDPGARVHFLHRSYTVSDPFRKPSSVFSTVLAPIGSMADKVKIARLRSHLLGMKIESVWEMKNQSTLDFLKEWGFSDKIIETFFRPFLSGIFLERELATSARMFAFVYRCFSTGAAALPAGGMSAIPNQMESHLKVDAVRLGKRVISVQPDSVELENGVQLRARAVVVATDGDQARNWFPDLPKREWTGGSCYYFDAPEVPFGLENLLWLNATGSGRINHIAVPSAITGGYVPPGRVLISVNTIGTDDPETPEQIQSELSGYFGERVKGWGFLRCYTIPKSLPRLRPEDLDAAVSIPRMINGIHLCGDFLFAGSLDGAMASGVQAANRILDEVLP